MYSDSKSIKSQVVSLRLSPEKIEQIKKEASNRRISFNVMANQILDEYFDFDIHAKKAGFMSVPKKTVGRMINMLSEDELTELSKTHAASGFLELVLMLKGKVTLESFLNIFIAWLRDSHFAYNDQFQKDGCRVITVSHGLGRNWSIHLKDFFMEMLKDMHATATFETLSDVVVISIVEEKP